MHVEVPRRTRVLRTQLSVTLTFKEGTKVLSASNQNFLMIICINLFCNPAKYKLDIALPNQDRHTDAHTPKNTPKVATMSRPSQESSTKTVLALLDCSP
jgi:hypothetical protein